MIELDTEEIIFAVDGHVATITLNRPAKLNSVTTEMSVALIAAVNYCNDTDDVRVVVVTGAGEKAFCAGSDIKGLDAFETAWDFRNRGGYCDEIRSLRKPTIAAINGYALGGGLETALSCDIRIASSNATFAAPEIKLGWIGGGGMASFLADSIGGSNAALMLFTGDAIDAETALRWSLISEIVAPEKLAARAAELAAIIASRAPIAAETAKANLRMMRGMTQEQAITYERDLQTICFATEDAAEGRLAFNERRTAIFRRR